MTGKRVANSNKATGNLQIAIFCAAWVSLAQWHRTPFSCCDSLGWKWEVKWQEILFNSNYHWADHCNGYTWKQLHEAVRPPHPTATIAAARTHTHLESSTPSMRRINVGMLGWKYFWPGSKPSYTPPRCHLPLIMSILYEYRPDNHLALLPSSFHSLLQPKRWWLSGFRKLDNDLNSDS